MKRLLILEPYYGGSHRLFLEGLQRTVAAEFTLFTLPARKWKMRMQVSALWFVEKIRELPVEERGFDAVLCSTFVDVAVLRSLLLAVSGWNPGARVLTYFHENQFAYPAQKRDASIRQFTAINFTTAMASDSSAFNSAYNRESLLQGVEVLLKKGSDMKLKYPLEEVRKKSVVLHPGMDYSFIDGVEEGERDQGPPVIVWNHRWEHDKGPETFFAALYQLQEAGASFGLIVLGQSFTHCPRCFSEARTRLAAETLHFGYAESREQYAALLQQGDCIVSTAHHEFFGISVLEGIRAGCYPLLPDDLSYPELYDKRYLYAPGTLASRLETFLLHPVRLGREAGRRITQGFAWKECHEQYQQWLFANPLEEK